MEFLKEYLGIIALAITGVTAWFGLKSRVEVLELKETRISKMLESIAEDVDELEKNESANNATRDQMLRMLEENRLDVKMILQQIATIAANQGKGKEKDE